MKNYFTLSTLLLCLAAVCMQSVNSYPQFCLEYRSSECIRCPQNTHVYKKQCYNDTIGCLQYSNGDECNRCNTTFTYLFNKKCIPLVEGAELQRYIQTNPGDRFGEAMFRFIPISNAQFDRFFQICDNFMKKGDYGHFISKSVQPIISVHTFDSTGVRQFKILYEGSGAGLLLCLIGISLETNKIELRSFVTIGVTKFVDLCIDYTTSSDCIRCDAGYHLENGVCYRNVPNCISFMKDICLQCRGFSLLVENRCISDCEVLRDTRSIRFYHNYVTGSALQNIDRAYFSM